MITLVVATDQNNGIGLNGTMPWDMKEDLRQFKAYTMNKLVVMGYRTWVHIPHGLPGREVLVLSRQKKDLTNARSVTSVEECLAIYKESNREMIIAGGGEVYRLFMPFVNQIRCTTFLFSTQVDTYFCGFDKNEWKKKESWRNKDMEIGTWKKQEGVKR